MSYRVHKLFCPISMVKNTKMQKFANRVLRSQPVTYDLENQQFRAVVKIHVRAKFHRAKCSGS